MERNQNYVELWGVAAGEPVFSHENHTRRVDKFPLRVERLSGQNDVPVIVASLVVKRAQLPDDTKALSLLHRADAQQCLARHDDGHVVLA